MCSLFSYSFALANNINMPKGDAIMVYSVASDIYCANNPTQYPQYTPIATRVKNNNNFTYIIPAAGSLIWTNGVITNSSCAKIKGNAAIDYFAKPQLLNPKGGYFFGSCQTGPDVTKYYKELGKNIIVLPLFGVTNLPTTVTDTTAFATAIAKIINSDTNAAGIALDYEPYPKPTPQIASKFMPVLASELAAKNKIMAVFDGISSISVAYQENKNIIALQALYGLDAFTTPSKALSPADYKKEIAPVEKFITPESFFAVHSGMPVLFVVPASATDRLYTNFVMYNINEYGFKRQSMQSPYTTTPVKCTPPNNPAQADLAKFLCLPKNGESPYTDECIAGSTAFSLFFNSKGKVGNISNQCNKYISNDGSTGYTMLSYMNIALNTIQTALNNPKLNHSGYLGISLYSARIPEFADFNAAAHFYNILYMKSLLSRIWITTPTAIPEHVWEYVKSNSPQSPK